MVFFFKQKTAYEILDLFRGQQRLAPVRRRHPRQPFGAEIRRHDGVRIDAAGIDDALADLALGEPRGAPQVGREVALEALLPERPAVAPQAHADLPSSDDPPTPPPT